MPRPFTEPRPLPAFRLSPPEEAHEASYFAASANISSFCNLLRRNTDLPNGRSYVIAEVSDGAFTDDMPEVLVEPGRYFVLGDNRDRSNDSRFPQFGTVPLAAIADKASIIWMSRDWRRIGKRLQPNP
jgi:hypothetical protein